MRHDTMETTLERLKSVTGKFRMTFSLEILTFSLKPVKFNPGTAGKSTELPAVNKTGFSEKVKILGLLVM